MASRGYKFGKAVAGNLIIIVIALAVLAAIVFLWPGTKAAPKTAAKSQVTPTQTKDEACRADRGERLQKATALFNTDQFDLAAEALFACTRSLSTEERALYVKALTAGNAARSKIAEADMGWKYSEETDPMTSKTTTHAMLRSNNSLNLDSPYSGINHAVLIVRKHPRYGTNVIFKIDQGQLMCSEISGCPIKVRFDDGAPMNFTGTEPADNDPSIVFINEKQRFMTAAAKAKNILVQMNIFHNGAPVLEFYSPSPLAWKPAK
jgi:hypothetical protein